MKRSFTLATVVLAAAGALTCGYVEAASPAIANPDFSGIWSFNPSRSKNIGMMSDLRLTSRIEQSARALIVTDVSSFNGSEMTRQTRYDLTGKAAANESFMGEKSETTSRWSDNKLVTNWVSEGAIAGTKTTRVETRYLESGNRTMVLESVRGSNQPIVMVFDKQ